MSNQIIGRHTTIKKASVFNGLRQSPRDAEHLTCLLSRVSGVRIPAGAPKKHRRPKAPCVFLVLQRGFESCTKATNAAFIAQFKNWAIPLFAFPSPARESKCKRIPAGAPPKKLPGAKRGGAEKKPGQVRGRCFPVPRKGKQMQANPAEAQKHPHSLIQVAGMICL